MPALNSVEQLRRGSWWKRGRGGKDGLARWKVHEKRRAPIRVKFRKYVVQEQDRSGTSTLGSETMTCKLECQRQTSLLTL